MKSNAPIAITTTTAALDINNAVTELKEKIVEGNPEQITAASVRLFWELLESYHSISEAVKEPEEGVQAAQVVQLTASLIETAVSKVEKTDTTEEIKLLVEGIKIGTGVTAIIKDIIEKCSKNKKDVEGQDPLKEVNDKIDKLAKLLDDLKKPADRRARSAMINVMNHRKRGGANEEVAQNNEKIQDLINLVNEYAAQKPNEDTIELKGEVTRVLKEMKVKENVKDSLEHTPPSDIVVNLSNKKGLVNEFIKLLECYVKVYNVNYAVISGSTASRSSSQVVDAKILATRPVKTKKDMKLRQKIQYAGRELQQSYEDLIYELNNVFGLDGDKLKNDLNLLFAYAHECALKVNVAGDRRTAPHNTSGSGSFADMTRPEGLNDSAENIREKFDPETKHDPNSILTSVVYVNEHREGATNPIDIDNAKTCLENFKREVRIIKEFYDEFKEHYQFNAQYPKENTSNLEKQLSKCEEKWTEVDKLNGEIKKYETNLKEHLNEKENKVFDSPPAKKPGQL